MKNNNKTINVSVPGKVILCGEHAILYGFSAISFSIKQRMNVSISQTEGDCVFIESDKFGSVVLKKKTKNCKVVAPEWCKTIVFLLQKIKYCGLKIKITSNIEDYGFGSSGALFSCICCGLLLLNNNTMNKKDLLKKTLDFYLELCKKNDFNFSGIDIVTSILGGIVNYNFYKKKAINIKTSIFNNYKFFAIWTGHKTDLNNVKKNISSIINAKNIYKNIGKITEDIYRILKCNKKNDMSFFEKISKNQEYLEQLNIIDDDLKNIINQCKEQGVAAKISGSGLGDCVIAICKKNKKFEIKKYRKIELDIDFLGIAYEFK